MRTIDPNFYDDNDGPPGWVRGALLLIIIILIALASSSRGAPIPGTSAMQIDLKEGVPGLWWDERVWTPVVIPYEPEVMLCRADSLGSIRCWLLPPASLLFLPVPQEDK